MEVSTGKCRWVPTAAHGEWCATSRTGESHPQDTGIAKHTASGNGSQLGLAAEGSHCTSRRALCGKIPQERTEIGRTRDGQLAAEHGQHLDHNNVSRIWTYVLLTTRHIAHTGSLLGPFVIHHVVEDCRVLWKTERRLKLIPAGLPRDHTPIPLALRYTLQPQRGEASTGLAGIRWDLQAMADCLPKGDKRLSALRRKLLNKHSAENRWESIGRHAGTWATALNNTCTHGTGTCR